MHSRGGLVETTDREERPRHRRDRHGHGGYWITVQSSGPFDALAGKSRYPLYDEPFDGTAVIETSLFRPDRDVRVAEQSSNVGAYRLPSASRADRARGGDETRWTRADQVDRPAARSASRASDHCVSSHQ